MENRRVTRGKKLKFEKMDTDESESDSSAKDTEADDLRKSKIRDTNKEFARRMTILHAWSDYWTDYTIREGEAYSKTEAKSIIKTRKKINCPFCRKAFTTIGGLRYHYARCNIERCFKCKVCNPHMELKTRGDLLRHMIRTHYTDLPALNDDQKEIANSFLNSTGRVEKHKGRKTTGDQEAQFNTKTYVKSYGDLVSGATAPENLDRRPFHEWSTYARDWELLASDIDRRRFTPPEKESVRFKSTIEADWNILRVGESLVQNETTTDSNNNNNSSINSFVFFTGGVSTCAAWMPKPSNEMTKECLAIAVNSCPMDKSVLYKDCKDITGCIQFWSATLANTASDSAKPCLDFMIGHNFGAISEMLWCPLGTSFDKPTDTKPANSLPRLGLLALACGDGQVRIISVPHPEHLLSRSFPGSHRQIDHLDAIPMFKVKPTATLMPPGVGSSTDYQPVVCTALTWNVEDNQRLIAAGYSNGTVALFDLANFSPILYSAQDHRHIYQPYKMWVAHCLPVVGVGLLSTDIEQALIATGSRDRMLKIWNSGDLNSCLTFDRAPVTRLVWDYRLRGVVVASEAAFTSFNNRVSYRFPVADGSAGVTVSTHRATVWGLASSVITSALATSDEAGEVFVAPTGRPAHKRTKSCLDTLSLFTMVPRADKTAAVQSTVEMDAASSSGRVNQSNSRLIVAESGLTTTNILVLDESQQFNENTDPNSEMAVLDETNEELQVEDDYTFAERPVANKPDKFLLPIDVKAVETYGDFKRNYGLEYYHYDYKLPNRGQKLPEAWLRAGNTNNIYCDRVCDYPFSSIRHLSWSPNTNSFSHLLSVSHIGLCRIDRVHVLEQIYKGNLDNLTNETAGRSS